jgi:hypothetical protein
MKKKLGYYIYIKWRIIINTQQRADLSGIVSNLTPKYMEKGGIT